MVRFYVVVFIVAGLASCQNDIETTTESENFCRERNRLIDTDKDDLYELVEPTLGEKITLQCRYCGERDDDHPKNWYKLDKMDDLKQYEVPLGMENDMSLNRIHTNSEHTLTIHNITEDDSGEYFCKGLDGLEVANKYNYLIDVSLLSDVPNEKGTAGAWSKYHDDHLVPINKLLNTSKGPEYDYLANDLHVSLELITEWEMSGPCEICGRPKGEGTRSRKGACRFKISPRGEVKAKNFYEKTVFRATHLSCRSMTLQKLIPGILNQTRIIPEFIEVERCDGVCNPDAEGVYKGWKTNKKKGYKYRKTFVLAEYAHLTLICPESTLDNKVVWKAKGRLIKPGQSYDPLKPNQEPRVTVDTFNTLYLYGVTKEEEGNYTCYVDDVRMQSVRVFVVSKARLLTQAFVRHMMYLAFVLSLTSSCYCAGLVVTFTRRKKFKTFEELHAELKKSKRIIDDDDVERSRKKVERRRSYEPPSSGSESDEEPRKKRKPFYKRLLNKVTKKRPYKRLPTDSPMSIARKHINLPSPVSPSTTSPSSPELTRKETSSEISLLNAAGPKYTKQKEAKAKKKISLKPPPRKPRTNSGSSTPAHKKKPKKSKTDIFVASPN